MAYREATMVEVKEVLRRWLAGTTTVRRYTASSFGKAAAGRRRGGGWGGTRPSRVLAATALSACSLYSDSVPEERAASQPRQ